MKKSIIVKKEKSVKNGYLFMLAALCLFASCSKQDAISPSASLVQAQAAKSGAIPATSPGTLVATIDVNGDGIADNIYNNGTSVVVVRGSTGVTDTYFISSGNWSIVPAAITDLDGVAGAEITVIVGEYVKIITDRKGTVTSYTLGLSDWSLITTGSNGVSDMDGIAGAEIAIANGNDLTILCQRTGTLTNYLISTGNWSLLSNGIQNFDGKPGNDIAVTIYTSSNIEIIHPKSGSTSTYSSNTFGISWYVQDYTVNGAGINIHIYSTTKGKTYTIDDATETISTP